VNPDGASVPRMSLAGRASDPSRRRPPAAVTRRRRRLAAAVAALSLGLTAAAAALSLPGLVEHPPRAVQSSDAEIVVTIAIVGVAFPLLGWSILRRMPDNRLGWVYLAVGAFNGLNVFASAYAPWAYATADGNVPLAAEMSWVAVWAWMPGFTLFSTLGILLFPDGRLPSPRWWPIVAVALVAFLVMFVPMAVATWPYRGPSLVQVAQGSPTADPAIRFASAMEGVGQVVMLVATLGSVAGLIARWRRARGVEQLQLKWFGYGALVEVAILASWFADVLGTILGVLSAILMGLALPLAIGIAVTRFRLWDIDRLVSRTIAWAVVTALLAAVFAGLVVGLQAVLASFTGASTLAVAASTLVVFALFTPLRRRVQRLVDRRFDRSRYDADRTVASLTLRLRDETDLDRVGAEIETAVRQTLAPSLVVVWTRAGGQR
jgi:hypothetical protein